MKIAEITQYIYMFVFLNIFLVFYVLFYKSHLTTFSFEALTMNKTEETEEITTSKSLPPLPTYQSWVINLPKNKSRLYMVMDDYRQSDLASTHPLERFDAIVGIKIEPKDWLSKQALEEYNLTTQRGYRRHHYELTAGGIGCFLSHTSLFQKLVDDSVNTHYVIFEDDIHIQHKILASIESCFQGETRPKDWDIILLGQHRCFQKKPFNTQFNQVFSFWGMFSYIINKKGAEKFLQKFNNHIDCQIDSLLSKWAIDGDFKIYSLTKPCVFPSSVEKTTDIQMPIVPLNYKDSFTYRGTFLG